MDDVAAAAPIHQHVVLITREPCVQPLDHAVDRRARDQFAALGAENADRRLGAGNHVEQFVTEQRWKKAAAGAEHDQVVVAARFIERAKRQMMHVCLARQQGVDHVAAETGRRNSYRHRRK